MSSSLEISQPILEQAIVWCNNNSGFLTGILSLLTLVVSVIAIVVSIRAARLPYKKKLLLSSSVDVHYFRDPISRKSASEILGLSVNAINVGNRDVNITYLGMIVKDKSILNGQQKLTKIRDEITGTGIMSPAEVLTETFKKTDLIYVLSGLNKNAKILLYAIDSEGKQYHKKAGYASDMLEQLKE